MGSNGTKAFKTVKQYWFSMIQYGPMSHYVVKIASKWCGRVQKWVKKCGPKWFKDVPNIKKYQVGHGLDLKSPARLFCLLQRFVIVFCLIYFFLEFLKIYLTLQLNLDTSLMIMIVMMIYSMGSASYKVQPGSCYL